MFLNSEHSSLMRVLIPIDFSCGKVEMDMWRIRLRLGLSPALNTSNAKCVCAPSYQLKPYGHSSMYVLISGASSTILFILVQYICIIHSPYLMLLLPSL